ncbi:MAG: 3-hydroxyacyl-CoA dehydrogenase family protein [Candidatus Alkanophagales archaeon]|nr:MAG: 3-hydroxyacyl-CoA dehydrogenase family protein [Candidatus Alkanophagales archaeon]
MQRFNMSVEEIKKIAQIGAGVMGHGIAQVAAMTGYDVALMDISKDALDRAMKLITVSLSKLVKKNKLTEEQKEAVLGKIKPTLDLKEAVQDADYVIEAVFESLDLKKQVFKEMDEIAPEHTILASNTSTIPATILGDATNRPDKVIDMHWFNPAQLMKLIEIMPGEKTSEETLKTTVELSKKLGKVPIVLKKDVWGYVTSRMAISFLYEGAWDLQRGMAEPKEIDAAVRYKLGFPMGPFELADLTGIDIGREMDEIVEELSKTHPAYVEGPVVRGPPIVKEYIEKGWHGMKSGKGFYEYPGPGVYKRVEIPEELKEKYDPTRFISTLVNVAAYLLRMEVSTRDDIDTMMKLGLGYPKGIFQFADEIGVGKVVETLKDAKERYGQNWYEPDPLLVEMAGAGKKFYE